MSQLSAQEIIDFIESVAQTERAEILGEVANAMFNRALSTPPFPADDSSIAFEIMSILYPYIYGLDLEEDKS